ncbi:hypothetical protein TRFO_32391 [Tritrichomonas foetus]|uniref:RING-type domain-containing protein n=1 Tax=Tritrichomonas foetus TaxID=1144522 RepID=A0A1J4JQ38_9EUKA|nr:hypothetical protein TRFO_32391 [Tritrichomonas foetus]|eukprot:OHT00866.1 hypothetical protein TRFO_32391 [Tritrichomonas foetus]
MNIFHNVKNLKRFFSKEVIIMRSPNFGRNYIRAPYINASTHVDFSRTAPRNMNSLYDSNDPFFPENPRNYQTGRSARFENDHDDSDDERFSIGRPRWEEGSPRERNPHQTQQLSQYELLGIPEPNFSTAPWRRDRTFTPQEYDEFDDPIPERYFASSHRRRMSNIYSSDNYSFSSTAYSRSNNVNINSRFTRTTARNSSNVTTGRTNRNARTSTINTRLSASLSNRLSLTGTSTNRSGRSIISPPTTRPNTNRNTGTSTNTSPTTNAKKKEEKPKPKVSLKLRDLTEAEVKDEATCAICLDTFKTGTKVAELKCGHIYHEDCVKPWVDGHTTCPVCRADVTDEEKAKK